MSLPLPKRDLERLAKVCGMFGSDHAGERAAAAATADSIVRQAGLRWPEVLSLTALPGPVSSIEQQIARALASDCINDWERRFLVSISGQDRLTPKQEIKLQQIIRKVDAFWRGAR